MSTITTANIFKDTYLIKNGEIINDINLNRAAWQLKSELDIIRENIINNGDDLILSNLTDISTTAYELNALHEAQCNYQDFFNLHAVSTKLHYLSNVSSDIQEQIDNVSLTTWTELGVTETNGEATIIINWLIDLYSDVNGDIGSNEFGALRGYNLAGHGNLENRFANIEGDLALLLAEIDGYDGSDVTVNDLNWLHSNRENLINLFGGESIDGYSFEHNFSTNHEIITSLSAVNGIITSVGTSPITADTIGATTKISPQVFHSTKEAIELINGEIIINLGNNDTSRVDIQEYILQTSGVNQNQLIGNSNPLVFDSVTNELTLYTNDPYVYHSVDLSSLDQTIPDAVNESRLLSEGTSLALNGNILSLSRGAGIPDTVDLSTLDLTGPQGASRGISSASWNGSILNIRLEDTQNYSFDIGSSFTSGSNNTPVTVSNNYDLSLSGTTLELNVNGVEQDSVNLSSLIAGLDTGSGLDIQQTIEDVIAGMNIGGSGNYVPLTGFNSYWTFAQSELQGASYQINSNRNHHTFHVENVYVGSSVSSSAGGYGHGISARSHSWHGAGVIGQTVGYDSNKGGAASGLLAMASDTWDSSWKTYARIATKTHGAFFHGPITGDGGFSNFTGVHGVLAKEQNYSVGDIVISIGSESLDVMDTIPFISVSSKKNDKKVLGVVGTIGLHEKMEDFITEYPALYKMNQEFPEITQAGKLFVAKYKEYKNAKVNSLGEGGINVCSLGGHIENGDYITTSELSGKGMLQADDLLHNYTVAKALEDVNWDKEVPGQNGCYEINGIKCKMIGCTYHCG